MEWEPLSALPPPVVVETVLDSAEASLMRDRLILLEELAAVFSSFWVYVGSTLSVSS